MLTTLKRSSPEKVLSIFLIGWTLLNSIQGYFMELHPDEAYYWLYSRFLDWGYFDHPPMAALFIKAGDLIFPSKLGLRLLTIISNTLSIYLLWQIVKKYSPDIKLFILLFTSILLFHVYGFITTPDSPLFFFSILFWYVYQRYSEQDKIKWALYLSLIIACLLYSKYHGVLILFFTTLSNFRLLKRPSFWFITSFALILFIPHILWQFKNGFPSLYYHLIDRSANPYQFTFTTEYLLSQIIIAGPLTGWFIYKSTISVKGTDPFIKALYFNFFGIFIFFLLSTFKGRVEAHWTLIGFVPLFILSYISLSQKNNIPKCFKKPAIANIILILLARFILIVPIPYIKDIKAVDYYWETEKWAKQIHAKAGNGFVIFQDGFQDASTYDFYNRTTKGFAYDTRYYRKTQFDIWSLEDSLRNKQVYYVLNSRHGKNIHEDTIRTGKGVFFGRRIDKVRLYQKVTITTNCITSTWKAGEICTLKIKIYNPYKDTITFSNNHVKWKCYLEYGFIKDGELQDFKSLTNSFEKLTILPRQTTEISENVQAPLQPGKYKLIFSVRTEPFPGSRNSNMISVNVIK